MKMVLLLGVMFILSNQPMMMISTLIFIILLYSLLMLWSLSSFWFSYMIILVLMSGVLVVFTYMMGVLPNESFEVSSLVMIVMGLVLTYKYFEFDEFILDESMSSMMIWEGTMFIMSLLLVVYLLGMMVIIVWMSMMEKGAIRIIY
uniref:NADH dehydrogenase subunit 6 n=1 Tax=Cyclosa argenteoalba TaxID=345692 RepID=A0A0K0NTX6_9ARAC|nr:NADH dehydrogenase subunit 6 [Cyclosa argenteoalba]AKN58358.1 NADH dehydrogenase subunit 6 [Cyclosa argenteoalba]